MEPINQILRPRIDAHLTTFQVALRGLAEQHTRLVEQTDLDLDGNSRWVAVWEITGRCIGLANALTDQLRRGYTAETVGTMRVLHEAANLIVIFADTEEDDLTRRWLRGRQVSQREARAHIIRYQERARELARANGINIEGDLADLTRQVYVGLSKGAHNTRSGFKEVIARDARIFSYGPHPDLRVLAVYIDYAGTLIEQIVIEVGMAFAMLLGPDYYEAEIKPFQDALHAIRAAANIDDETRAALGYG